MTVACYVDPLPDGRPVRGTAPCRDCEHYKHQRCPGCMGTGVESTEDWGPYKSGSFTSSTMDRTLLYLGLVDGETGESVEEFTVLDLREGLRKTYCAPDDATLVRTDAFNATIAGSPFDNATSIVRCQRELLRWYVGLLTAEGVDVETTRVYVA